MTKSDTEKLSAKEKLRRRRISASLLNSEKQRAYHDRLRGVARGPEGLKTRAKKSASKKAEPGTKAWDFYYKQALERLRLEAKQAKARDAAFS